MTKSWIFNIYTMVGSVVFIMVFGIIEVIKDLTITIKNFKSGEKTANALNAYRTQLIRIADNYDKQLDNMEKYLRKVDKAAS